LVCYKFVINYLVFNSLHFKIFKMKKREIVKYGNSFLIRLSPSDMEDMELKEGDLVDIEDITKIKNVKQNR